MLPRQATATSTPGHGRRPDASVLGWELDWKPDEGNLGGLERTG